MISVRKAEEYKTQVTHETSEIKKFVLSDVFFQHVFALLPTNTLATTSLVCKRWRDATACYDWQKAARMKLGENALTNWNPYVGANRFTWQDIFRFITPSLMQFFDQRMVEDKLRDSMEIYETVNPQHLRFDEEFMHLLVVSLPWYFSVDNSTNIKVNNAVTGASYILISPSTNIITHLAVNETYVFALFQNGQIGHWNYKTKEFLGLIETSYSQRDERLKKIRHELEDDKENCNHTLAFSSGFFVHEGRIFVIYGKSFVEVIKCKDNNYSYSLLAFQLEDSEDEVQPYPIIMREKLFCFSYDSCFRVEVINLESMSFIFDLQLEVSFARSIASAEDKNVLYVGIANKLIAFNANHEILFNEEVFSRGECIRNIALVEEIIICYVSNNDRGERVEFLDRNSLARISLIEPENASNNSRDFLATLFS